MESQYIQKEKTSQEQAKVAAQVQAQRVIAEKNEEVEAAFARARAAKSESGWNEARVAAMTVSNYWNGIVEAIQTGRSPLSLSQEEATVQKNYWMKKAGVAEVKALGASPCGNNWKANNWKTKRERSDAMMAMIKDKVWSFTSQAMKAFIDHPNEARMLAGCASASASAFSSASASAFASASASAHAYAYEAMEAASVADDTEIFAEMLSKKLFTESQQITINLSVSVARETADFVRAVAKYKKTDYREQVTGNMGQEGMGDGSRDNEAIAAVRPLPEWETDIKAVKAVFARAIAAKNESTWREAKVAAREAVRLCQNVQGMSSREAIEAAQQRDYWAEQVNLADIKALATSPYASDFTSQRNRANAIINMTHEKLGSPVSVTMKEFMVNPNKTTLRATGKSAIIAMSSTEAEEVLEGADVFATISRACPKAPGILCARGFEG